MRVLTMLHEPSSGRGLCGDVACGGEAGWPSGSLGTMCSVSSNGHPVPSLPS